jgi:hypothetical protein
MAIEILSSRILDIALDELPKRSLGLNILGIDVEWGLWDITTPAGPGQTWSYAILTSVRETGPKGEVLLGDRTPVTNAHVLSGTWPSETEIRDGISKSCDALREHMQGLITQQNGHQALQDPLAAFRPKKHPKD